MDKQLRLLAEILRWVAAAHRTGLEVDVEAAMALAPALNQIGDVFGEVSCLSELKLCHSHSSFHFQAFLCINVFCSTLFVCFQSRIILAFSCASF